MTRRTMSRGPATRGRSLSAFLERVMGDIGSGRYQRGGFLPPVRDLGSRYSTSPETARRGLKLLQGQGILTAEGRAGFRVARKREDRKTRPVAFVTTADPAMPQVQPTTAAIFLAFQAAGARRGWPFLIAHAGSDGVEAVADQLRGSNAWGAVVDTINPGLYSTVVGCGLPTVMVNSWVEDSPVSTVLQDNYRGGYLAAEHLLARGARQMAWVGPVDAFCHTRERFAGANACLQAGGGGISPEALFNPAEGELRDRLSRLLGGSDRPDGIMAFTMDGAAAVKRAADEHGLLIGRDFELVSWVAEECYETSYLPVFRGGEAAPAVVWSAATMVDRALALLAEVGDGLTGQPVRVCVPTRLRLRAEEAASPSDAASKRVKGEES